MCQYLTRSKMNFLPSFRSFVIMLLVTMCHVNNKKTFNDIVSVRHGLLFRSTTVVISQLPLKLSLDISLSIFPFCAALGKNR